MQEQENTPNSVQKLTLGDRTILLLGTAHISGTSVQEVEDVIRTERPDVVLVELDPARLESLRDPETWRKLDIRQVLKNGQLPTLIANLVLASWQRRMGNQTGVRPGSELLRAVEVSEELNIPYILGDRPIRSTLKRLWASVGWMQKMGLISSLIGSLFDKSQVSEQQLQEMRQGEDLQKMLEEFGNDLPLLRQILIDERDATMAEHLQASPARKILAVVGAAHVPGMIRRLEARERADLAELEIIPKPSLLQKSAPYLLSLALIGALVYFVSGKSLEQLQVDVMIWIAWTSLPAAAAALVVRAHPIVFLQCTLLAPIAAFLRIIPGPKLSLITALTQAWLKPPTVHDMEKVADEIGSLSGWMGNRLLRIALVFVLPGLATTSGAAFALLHISSKTIP